jgi:hypothetical protein
VKINHRITIWNGLQNMLRSKFLRNNTKCNIYETGCTLW